MMRVQSRNAMLPLLLTVVYSFVCPSVVASDPEKGILAEPAPDPAVEGALRRGYDLLQADQMGEAENVFLEILNRDPSVRRAHFGLGTVYIKQRRYRDAMDTLEQLRRAAPKDFPVLNNLAWLYATASDLSVRHGQRAVALAQEALLIQPNSYQVWNTLSEGHYVSGDYERAARAAEEALRLARTLRVEENRLQEYQRQVAKCRQAAQAQELLQ